MRKLIWPFRSRNLLIHAGSHIVWKENSTGQYGVSAKHIHVGGHGCRSSLHLKWQGRKASHMSALTFENTDVIMDGSWDIPLARQITFRKGTTLHMNNLEEDVILAPNAKIRLENITLNLGNTPIKAGCEFPVLKGRDIRIKGQFLVRSTSDDLRFDWRHCPVQGLLIRAQEGAGPSLAA